MSDLSCVRSEDDCEVNERRSPRDIGPSFRVRSGQPIEERAAITGGSSRTSATASP